MVLYGFCSAFSFFFFFGGGGGRGRLSLIGFYVALSCF